MFSLFPLWYQQYAGVVMLIVALMLVLFANHMVSCHSLHLPRQPSPSVTFSFSFALLLYHPYHYIHPTTMSTSHLTFDLPHSYYVQEERLSEGHKVIRLDCCCAERAQRNRKEKEKVSESSPLLSSHSGHRYSSEVKMATVMVQN